MRDLFGSARELMNSQNERPRRGKVLIADFELGYARGWAFNVGAWARGALSIILADLVKVDRKLIDGRKVKKSVPYKAWVQGCTFNFTEGSLLHQGDGSPKGSICSVQVVQSVSSGRIAEGDGYAFDPGRVQFELFEPKGGRFVRRGVYEGTQLQFILLLRHGVDHFMKIGFEESEVLYAGPVV